jgi:hypothetical protein
MKARRGRKENEASARGARRTNFGGKRGNRAIGENGNAVVARWFVASVVVNRAIFLATRTPPSA